MLYHEFMLKLAIKYNNLIQIAFKPHPILRPKLSDNRVWGKKKTDYYYNKWDKLENGQIHEGSYVDLFLTTDALIHDSGSFMIEFLYTGKPLLHTNRDTHIKDRLNSFGELAFDCHYHALNEEDIVVFINNLLYSIDPMRINRQDFFNKFLIPPNQQSASQNIVDDLITEIYESKSNIIVG